MTSLGGGKCWHCGAELTALDYGRGDSCRKCHRDTRVCKACIHYDPIAHNECRETEADRVVEKERSNFCDYFKPSGGPGGKNGGSAKDAARAAAEALFKKS